MPTSIGITIAASLIIAAVVNERAQAWALLDSRNLYLEKQVDVKVEILRTGPVRSLSTEEAFYSRPRVELVDPTDACSLKPN